MLPRSVTSFTLKQDPQDSPLKSSKSQRISKYNAGGAALRCLPGETIQEEAIRVKKCVHYNDGPHYILGTLYCTNYRTAFRREHPDKDPPAEVLFDNDNDMALPSVDRIVAVAGQTKMKVVTAQSNLKFIPEELLIYYKGFRLMRFLFSNDGLQTQAYKIIKAILQYQQKSCLTMKKRNSTVLQNPDNKQDGSSMDFTTKFFESYSDWENEIDRLGASAWRVSPVNERYDTSTSLSKYIVVPCKLLDIDLKKTFAHFNQRRVPRWSWHHRGGSDLLRSAGFETNTDPDKENMRSIRSLLFANHSQCLIVDTNEELPSVSDIQLSYGKLRSLCLNDPSITVSDEKWLSNLEGTRWLDHVRLCLKKSSDVSGFLSEGKRSVVLQESEDRDLNCLLASLVQLMSDPFVRTISGFQSLVQKEWLSAGHPFLQRINPFKETDKDESPVFQLFLDCVWQLIQQFPNAFEFTESYLLALHDSAFHPFCSSFMYNCQWERIRGCQRQFYSQTYTPVNGWRDVVQDRILYNGDYKGVEEGKPTPVTVWRWDLFYDHLHRQQFRNPFYQNKKQTVQNGNGITDKTSMLDAPNQLQMYRLCRGSLVLQSPLLSLKNGAVAKKGARRSQSVENLLDEERQFRGHISTQHYTSDLLQPLWVGPWVRLWKRCYLRCATEMQLDLPPPSAAALAKELKSLLEKLKNFHIPNSQEPSASLTIQTGGNGFSPSSYG
ncbi:myotubularin-related protein 11 isoform X2 [Xenopus laevis]|uniref:Myotubularin-related protein 11 isoform X2 n=1 Tax=Xenopus laevis TaxID=8355 RepID=A0A8J0TRJ2_XENLA|nr:myotubularin-related protein 11 isoform X2 [Xenopus laevis]